MSDRRGDFSMFTEKNKSWPLHAAGELHSDLIHICLSSSLEEGTGSEECFFTFG